MSEEEKDEISSSKGGLGIGGLLRGLGDLVEKLGEIAETGETISRSGELRGPGKEVKGIYGFTVKVGLGEDKPKVESFGNIRRDAQSGLTEVQEVREPLVDVFEEAEHVLVVAELPGIGAKDVRVEVKDDVLTITAEKGEKKYRKEVLLPRSVSREKINVSCNNGVLEVKCLS
jgi:HSP20 family protein